MGYLTPYDVYIHVLFVGYNSHVDGLPDSIRCLHTCAICGV